jgi:hypothetical protein
METRLTPDLELDHLSPGEAFAILGDDTRLDIIRVLWEADAFREFDDGPDRAEYLAYSTLRREVAVDDNGRFNYHLSKLTPYFVRSTEDGYRLSDAGKRIARTVVAVSGTDSRDLSADLEQSCPLCGGTVAATYDDQWLRVRCTECDGMFGDDAPDGALFLSHFPAAGMASRQPAAALRTAVYRCQLDLMYLMGGICRECAGRVTGSISVCGEHEPGNEASCPHCGTRFAVWGDRRCETCGFAKRLPVAGFTLGLPPVLAFLQDQQIGAVSPTFDTAFELLEEHVETAIDTDGEGVTVTIQGQDAMMTVAFDDSLNVAEVRGPNPAG